MLRFVARRDVMGRARIMSAGASIVNLGSISSVIAQQGMATYATTKGAVLQLTRSVWLVAWPCGVLTIGSWGRGFIGSATAVDCGQYGIRCNAVCPGPILTVATRQHAESQVRGHWVASCGSGLL
jgi:NAD(P)-dependent dehydrogenase (short-subunit alcohol dehydrogenase family)